MALVEVIDLTGSPPPNSPQVIVIDDDEGPAKTSGTAEKETKKRRRSRKGHRERDGQRSYEDMSREDSWKHEKLLDSDRNRRGEKKEWEEDADGSKHPTRRKRHSSPQLFTVDTTSGDVVESPVPLQMDIISDAAAPLHGVRSVDGLLLPAHVTLSTQDSVPISNVNPPLSPISEASGIDFLDDDRAVGAPRYFDDRATNPKPRLRAPCKRCGDDDHDVKSCPNMICLTCGARNEHNPRSCPILRFCWDCKGKGHIARDCPRIGNKNSQNLDCERCGSWNHHGTNCPTIWRIYTYLTDAERETVLTDRESKSQLDFDEGGEGYIARDQWCYNCGGSGHLGDDCKVAAPNHDRPKEYSAFGSHNFFTGPFASPTTVVPDIPRMPREWEQGCHWNEGSSFAAEDNVGRMGRENAKAKAREAQRLLEEDDDEPDWFTRNRRGASDGQGKANIPSKHNAAGLPPKPSPTIRFQKSGPSRLPRDSELPKRPQSSLRDRIDMGDGRRSGGSRRHQEAKGRKDRRRHDGEAREDSRRDGSDVRIRPRDGELRRDTDRSRAHDQSSREGGSRWRGGYDR